MSQQHVCLEGELCTKLVLGGGPTCPKKEAKGFQEGVRSRGWEEAG